jgi:hypothetical protein
MKVLWRCVAAVLTAALWVAAYRRNRRWKADAAQWEHERDDHWAAMPL